MLIENTTNSAKLELELGLSLAIVYLEMSHPPTKNMPPPQRYNLFSILIQNNYKRRHNGLSINNISSPSKKYPPCFHSFVGSTLHLIVFYSKFPPPKKYPPYLYSFVGSNLHLIDLYQNFVSNEDTM